MKVLLISTSDIGGAANACLRLHDGLLKTGIDSKVILMQKQKQIPKTYLALPKKKTILQRTIKLLLKFLIEVKILKRKITNEEIFIKSRSPKLELFSYPFSDYDITENEWYKQADIINLHWVAGFLDYESFFKKNIKPVVWTFHDMNPFTGGEHYVETIIDVDNFGKPVLRKKDTLELQIEAHYLKLKKEVFKNVKNLTIVAPSKWLINETVKSKVFNNNNKIHIPYGLDKDIYNIRDKGFCRELLNIPKDKKVVLFVAESINNNNRKGFVFLKKVFDKLENNNIVLCAVGNKKAPIESPINLIELGVIHDEKMMSMVYSAADVFVIPSLMDNFPNTVLESLMCGTPVISFPVGGIIEIIQDDINGYIANEINAESLKSTLLKFIDNIDKFNPHAIRLKAIEKFDLIQQAKEYVCVYNSILT